MMFVDDCALLIFTIINTIISIVFIKKKKSILLELQTGWMLLACEGEKSVST